MTDSLCRKRKLADSFISCVTAETPVSLSDREMGKVNNGFWHNQGRGGGGGGGDLIKAMKSYIIITVIRDDYN